MSTTEVAPALQPPVVIVEPTQLVNGVSSTGADGTVQFTFALAAPSSEEAPLDDSRFKVRLVVEGLRTTDNRQIEPGALAWRDLPLPLMAQFKTPEFGGHAGSVPVGCIESIIREGNEILGEGRWSVDSDSEEHAANARRARDMAGDGSLRFVSIDMEPIETAFIPTGDADDDGIEALLFPEGYLSVIEGRIMGCSQVAFPAFPQACIACAGQDLPIVEPYKKTDDGVLIASGEGFGELVPVPLKPPRAWFEDPQLSDLTHVTITDDGRVFGHIAGWKVAYRGFDGRVRYAPHNESGYREFLTAPAHCEDGSVVAIGRMTMDTGHADLKANALVARRHYDDTGAQAAYVNVGEDEHGIWVAGMVRPGTTLAQLVTMRASDWSGDWRPLSGRLEMLAVLGVNFAGFPTYDDVTRAACFAIRGDWDAPSALVGAGFVRHLDPVRVLAHRLGELERTVAVLAPSALDVLDARLDVLASDATL